MSRAASTDSRSTLPPSELSNRVAALWNYLSSWISPNGGVNGPVVHRGDLKRLFAVHDTAWTQQAVIRGLLHLCRRSGKAYWLDAALRLADAQCARQTADGSFRRAGHEDDRFSSLVHNALADSALLEAAAVLQDEGELARRERYVAVAAKNIESYLLAQLHRPRLRGFAMNPVDYYAGRDRFIVNMNAAAVEAMLQLDCARRETRYAALAHEIIQRILSLQAQKGRACGSFAYSDVEADGHVSLYTGLTLSGLASAERLLRGAVPPDNFREAMGFLRGVEDPESGLWFHKIHGDRLYQYPLFVAGAGMICNGLLDAAEIVASPFDAEGLAARLLKHQYPNGAIKNFIGYDHPDNGRRAGSGAECWEDIYPTPNWNAQAFHFLCRVLPPPEPPQRTRRRRASIGARGYFYYEDRAFSAVVGLRPLPRGVAAVYIKALRYGLVIPGAHTLLRAVVRLLMKLRSGRAVLRWIRRRTGRGPESLAPV
jgi:hypothetical protein